MARLSIYLLDSFRATLDAKPIAFEYDKVRALLAYLIMESDRPIHREKLAAFLWPERAQEAASNGLRQALSKLRKALSDNISEEPFLIVQGDTIQFNPLCDVWVDAWAFNKLLKDAAGHRHRHIQSCSTCAHLMIQACELYRDDFLAWLFIPDSNAFEEWATIQRVHMRSQASEALLNLTAYHASLEDYIQVQVFTDRLLELDPLSEEAHCQKMIALASLGKRSQAIAYFKTFSRHLHDELGISPSAEICKLVQNIQSGVPVSKPDATNLILSGITIPDKPMAGREAERAEMQAWLESSDRRLITLSGPGGIGKTRLALEVGLSQKATFTHGVVLVNLSQVSSTNSFVPAVLEALHLSASDSQASEMLLFDYFRKREVLLILDSFDYVLESKSILAQLLEYSPELVVLVTSRTHLNLPEEWIFDLGGLEVPPVSVD
ncbi:MAG TPA: BTAD domain-containing putative transcriptional regulator, partial [Anaerolineales bacterium]|nr:BTAD domain-containing putative transcriptional regulator [Anaerolineales bacterium]